MALKTNSTVQSMKKKFDSKKSKINSTKETTISKSNGNESSNKSKHIIFDDDGDDNGEVKTKIVTSEKPNKANKSRKNAIEIGKQWYLRVCFSCIEINSMGKLIVRHSFINFSLKNTMRERNRLT